MKKFVIIFAIFFVHFPWVGTEIFAQSGAAINTTGNPSDASAILDVSSTTSPYQGMLTPRMTTANRNAIVSPATGLHIFNTDCNVDEYYTGLC